jgi:YfiH family protein
LLRQDRDGLVTYRFESLSTAGLSHAVFTRLGGISREPFATLNVGRSVGDDAVAVAENHARVYAHLGLTADRVTTAGQVHGNHVALVKAGDGGRLFPNTDGLVTTQPGIALMLRFADCQPILLYDPVHHALGLVHAGWRGIAQGIALRAVEKMQDLFGSHPAELIAGLGPAIGPCCYTVGHDVAAAMGYALPDWSQVMTPKGDDAWRLDLPAANAQQLTAAGVCTIEQAGLCTATHNDEFFSHRADQGRTGRFAVVALLVEGGQELRGKGPETREQEPEQASQEAEAAMGMDLLHPPGFPPFGEPPEGSR